MAIMELELKNFESELTLKSDKEGNKVSDEQTSEVVVKSSLSTNIIMTLSLPEHSSIKFGNHRQKMVLDPFPVKANDRVSKPITWQLRRQRPPVTDYVDIEVVAVDQKNPQEKEFAIHTVHLREE